MASQQPTKNDKQIGGGCDNVKLGRQGWRKA